MDINQLANIVKKKIKQNVKCDNIEVIDKTFLHKNHKSHQKDKFHILLNIQSSELKKLNKIMSTKKIYSILKEELKEYIHSIQILIQ